MFGQLLLYLCSRNMKQITDIPNWIGNQPLPFKKMELMKAVDRSIRGSVNYSIRRYRKEEIQEIQDTAMLVYHYEKNNASENYLELKFCVSGNFYCREKQSECDFCKFNASSQCAEKTASIDTLSFRFSPTYLQQFSKVHKQTVSFADRVISFEHDTSFTKTMPLYGKTRTAIEALLNHTFTDTLENIFINAQTQILFLYSTEFILGEKETAQYESKFLSNEADRDKIIKAREILLLHIGEPITIKALSRKVAINECYLKKGFKEIFGTTIFDFYQSQRMEHAKYLLYEKGLSVTEVSSMLGYSSISHFSTAFKKHTGIKPCELLIRLENNQIK